MMHGIPLIIIWLGEKYPAWGLPSLKANANLSGCPVYLVTPRSNRLFNKASRLDGVRVFDAEEYISLAALPARYPSSIDQDFNNGFWKLSIDRFFVADAFIAKNRIQKFFCAELDNITYALDKVYKEIDSEHHGVFMVRETVDRACPGFLYFNSKTVHHSMVNYFRDRLESDDGSGFISDMTLLSQYQEHFEKNCRLLNSASRLFGLAPGHYKSIENMASERMLFDGCSVGQFLFGLDCRYNQNWNNRHHSLPVSLDEWQRLHFMLYSDCSIGIIDAEGIERKVHVVHIHSKNIHACTSKQRLEVILSRVNKGMTTKTSSLLLKFKLLGLKEVVLALIRKITSVKFLR